MTDPQTRIQERLEHNSWGFFSTQGYVLGIDLGGYGLRAALIDLQTHRYISTHAEMPSTEPQQILTRVFAIIQQLLDDNAITARQLLRIGVGFGGPVDLHHGRIRLSPRMRGWENFSLKDHFEQTFDTVTLVENDANLIALGEATFGIGHGSNNLFYMHISGGVGGGIVIDGHLYHGATAMAGEIGHTVIDLSHHTGDGHLLRLEEQVSVAGLIRQANALGLQTNDIAMVFHDTDVGSRVINEAVNLLALRIAQIVSLLDPQMVVLGGTVVRTGSDRFVYAIARQMLHYMNPHIAHPVQVVESVLGAESIAIGALALALKSLQD